MKLPATLYVKWGEPNSGDPWLNAATAAEDLLETPTDEKTIGVYELKEMVIAKSSVTIQRKYK